MAALTFLSCHLTGTGHLVRTLTLARAALARGHRVRVITGGRPLPHLDPGGVDLVQLPPLTVQGFEFGTLYSADGDQAGDAYMALRARALTAEFAANPPDALITELFPLGRRMLAPEFLHAIAATRAVNAKARIICSVRDIPEPKPKRLAEAAERLRAHYDAVIVHGDAGFLPLSTTWPLAGDLAPRIHHTGYVGTPLPAPTAAPKEILVSVGGGILGRDVLEIAAQASAQSPHPWRLLTGGADAEALANDLTTRHPYQNLTVEPVRPDYLQVLANSALSISLCGYNTAVAVATGTMPAILIPSEEADEQEQLIRARALSGAQGVALIRAADLTAEGLAAQADAMIGQRRPPIPLAVDDGTGAIECLERLLENPK